MKSPKNLVEAIKMNFFEALEQIAEGKRITRTEWNNKKIYGFLNKDVLSLHKTDGKNYQWIVNEGDMVAKDWVIV